MLFSMHCMFTCVMLDVLDTDGFVIPSLGIGDPDESKPGGVEEEISKPPSLKVRQELYLVKMIILKHYS